MGNTDSVPVLSQTKSAFQAICGDTNGAKTTQKNFIKECPVVSQVTSSIQLIAGNRRGAIETQKRCGTAMLNMMDGFPGVGHVKGVVHYAIGDKEGGHRAMKSASRTTGVLIGGATGFILGGPLGAVAGGVFGGASVDTLSTGIESSIHREFRPNGYYSGINNAIINANPGDIFDLTLMPVFDGLAGYGAGNIVKNMQTPANVTKYSTPCNCGCARRARIRQSNTNTAKTLTVIKPINIEQQEEQQHPQQQQNPQQNTQQNPPQQNPPQQNPPQQNPPQQNPPQQNPPQQNPPQQNSSQENPLQHHQHLQNSLQHPQQQIRRRRTQRQCTCRKINLRVLFLNVRSINPKSRVTKEKIAKIRKLIRDNNPNIIVFVESWLNNNHDDNDIINLLGLQGYILSRQDRGNANLHNAYYRNDEEAAANTQNTGRRGGGIFVAYRSSDCPILFNRTFSEDLCDNIMNFDIDYQFNCRICNSTNVEIKIGFIVVYRRPAPFKDQERENFDEMDDATLDRLEHLKYYYDPYGPDGYNGYVIVGDFNFRNNQTDLISVPTHIGGHSLDQVIRNPLELIDHVVVSEPISDHSSLTFQINLGKDFSDDNPCDFCQN